MVNLYISFFQRNYNNRNGKRNENEGKVMRILWKHRDATQLKTAEIRDDLCDSL